MDSLGNQFLAGSTGPLDKYIDIDTRHFFYMGKNLAHGCTLPDNLFERICIFEFSLQTFNLMGHSEHFDGTFHIGVQANFIHGFDHVIKGAHLHGLHSRIKGRIVRHHNDRDIPVGQSKTLQNFQPGHTGNINI